MTDVQHDLEFRIPKEKISPLPIVGDVVELNSQKYSLSAYVVVVDIEDGQSEALVKAVWYKASEQTWHTPTP